MATANPFDVLGDDDTDDPTQLVAVQQQKLAADEPTQTSAKLSSKSLPAFQAATEGRSNAAFSRGSGRGGGQGRGRGGRGGAGSNRDFGNGNVDRFVGTNGRGGGGQNGDSGSPGDRERRGSYGGPRQSYDGYRRSGYANEEGGGDFERPRTFDHRSGTVRGTEFKREGPGRGKWGTYNNVAVTQESTEVVNVEDKVPCPEKQVEQEVTPIIETNKENNEGPINGHEEKVEDKEMTLEEYEKIREKQKALLSVKTEERKVDFDKELLSMQQLTIKKGNDVIFIKLGSDKEMKKQKDHAGRDEKVKKSVSINEFLKPAEVEGYYTQGGRGRGKGRRDRGPFQGTFGRGGSASGETEAVIKIEDPGQFPTLGGK